MAGPVHEVAGRLLFTCHVRHSPSLRETNKKALLLCAENFFLARRTESSFCNANGLEI